MQITERVLSRTWLMWIGKLSYSLYLWHWPIYCFVDYSLYAEPAWTRLGLKAALTLACSVGSYFLVEKPSRQYLNLAPRRQIAFGGLAAAVSLFLAAGLYLRNENFVNSSPTAVSRGGIEFSVGPSAPSVVLMGDSHGSTYAKMVKELAQEQGFNLNVLSSAGGNPLPGSLLYADSLTFLAKRKPDVTIFVAEWAAKLNDENKSVLLTAIDGILQHSACVVLITQPPTLPFDSSRRALRQYGVHPIREDPGLAGHRQSINEFIRSLASDRVHVIDIDPLLITSSGEMHFCDERGRQLYQDRKHLSGNGAALVKQPLSETLLVLTQARRVDPSPARRPLDRLD
jgi:hypothetical protein